MIKISSNLTFGDLEIKNGRIQIDQTLETPVFISLFGGNKEADSSTFKNPGGVKNLDWFGNLYQQKEGKELFNSKFERATLEKPIISGNIREFEKAALEDLQWLINSKAVSGVKVDISLTAKDTLKIEIMLNRNGITVGKFQYLFEVAK